jgi:hypothetical protein
LRKANSCLTWSLQDARLPIPIRKVGRKQLKLSRIYGIHEGPFAGIPPTGTHVALELMAFYWISKRSIAEHWMHMDKHGLIDQLTQ